MGSIGALTLDIINTLRRRGGKQTGLENSNSYPSDEIMRWLSQQSWSEMGCGLIFSTVTQILFMFPDKQGVQGTCTYSFPPCSLIKWSHLLLELVQSRLSRHLFVGRR